MARNKLAAEIEAHPAGERAALHARSRAFLFAHALGRSPRESFDELGCAIARYQAEHVPAYAKLLASRGLGGPGSFAEARGDPASPRASLQRLGDFPAVPTDAFKLTRVAAHEPAADRAVFRTSGTTMGEARGEHALSTTATYQIAALAWGAWGLFPDRAPPAPLLAAREPPSSERPLVWIVAAPRPAAAPDSSLGFMLELFGRYFARQTVYIVDEGRIDLGALERALERAARLEADVAVGGTSFALVHLLDAAAGRRFPLPGRARVMHTGGFKGKSREVHPAELAGAVAELFGLDPRAIVGEYGMTELSSQLYEGALRALFGFELPRGARPVQGVFFAPPWVRVVPVAGERLEPVAEGEVGLLRIEDLANVDAAVAIQTADLGRIVAGGGVELLGRAPGAAARGCSIAVDAMLARDPPHPDSSWRTGS